MTNLVEITQFEALALHKHYREMAKKCQEQGLLSIVGEYNLKANEWLDLAIDIAKELESKNVQPINHNQIEIMTNKSNENELKHRLEMIEDDLRVIREFIYARGLSDVFKEPSKTSEEVWNNLNNIEIACDLSSDESLSWRLYRD